MLKKLYDIPKIESTSAILFVFKNIYQLYLRTHILIFSMTEFSSSSNSGDLISKHRDSSPEI